jgi:hypothetical protein
MFLVVKTLRYNNSVLKGHCITTRRNTAGNAHPNNRSVRAMEKLVPYRVAVGCYALLLAGRDKVSIIIP